MKDANHHLKHVQKKVIQSSRKESNLNNQNHHKYPGAPFTDIYPGIEVKANQRFRS